MRIALAQLNPVVGEVKGNTSKVRAAIARAADQGAEFVVFTEMVLIGYPPRDLLDDPALVAENVAALDQIAGDCRGIAALVGFVRPSSEGAGPGLEDAAALLADGRVQHVHVKALLPNYDVYDDARYFRPGSEPTCSQLHGRRFAVLVCEDLWDRAALGRDRYGVDPVAQVLGQEVEFIINVAASGYEWGKARRRESLLARQAQRTAATILYVNQVGGNDEMIFDGSSCAVSASGEILARAASFQEDLLLMDTTEGGGRREALGDEMARLAEALKLGLRDYVGKSGFDGVAVALRGDLGSAVVTTLAVEALGSEFVHALGFADGEEGIPSTVRHLARNLGIALRPVRAAVMSEAASALMEVSAGPLPLKELHARLCGEVLALNTHATGRLALAAAHKTDLALGRCTPADATTVALAPLGDVLERDVLRLAEHLNARQDRIPKQTMEAVRDGGVDEIVQRYVECGQSIDDMSRDGVDRRLAERTIRLIDRAEPKRRQAPPVLKVTARAFGSGRRIPVARRYT